MVYGPGETPISKTDRVTITRDEAEVFNPKTIASFEGKPVTIRHPEDFVNPESWKDLAKGVMQNVRRGTGDMKDDLIADLLITDKMAIGLVKNGLREVSCGYEADYVQTGDTTGKQKGIIGNHLALVDQGRAGSGYAINDHKGETTMTFSERVKAIFAKAQDEAMKVAQDEEKKVDAAKSKDEDKKDDKTKDSDPTGVYDELVKMVKDLGEKVSALAPKAKDEDKKDEPAKDEDKKDDDKAKDEDKDKEDKTKDEPAGIEDRLKALEACVQKLLDNKAQDEDADKDESEDEGEVVESEDEDKESEDDDFENSTMIGDSAEVLSRAEILAPGIEASKDIVVKALKASYATKAGKKVIETLTGGKAPTFDSAEKIQTLFVAASEVLKASRTADLSKTKKVTKTTDSEVSGPMTPERMNEVNANFYKNA